jgi:hypothetical protein
MPMLQAGATLCVPQMPSFIGILDVLPIFGAQRMCVHDYIARTQVVKVPRPLAKA